MAITKFVGSDDFSMANFNNKIDEINNSGFITSAQVPVQSVNGQTGAVVIPTGSSEITFAQNTMPSQYKQNLAICSKTLQAGTYFIYGHIRTNIDNSSILTSVAVDYEADYDAGKIIEDCNFGACRIYSNSGGGVMTMAYVKCNDEITVNLLSYGYYNATYDIIGSMIVQKLN